MVETLAMGRFYTHARPNNFHYQGVHRGNFAAPI